MKLDPMNALIFSNRIIWESISRIFGNSYVIHWLITLNHRSSFLTIEVFNNVKQTIFIRFIWSSIFTTSPHINNKYEGGSTIQHQNVNSRLNEVNRNYSNQINLFEKYNDWSFSDALIFCLRHFLLKSNKNLNFD